MVKAHSGQVALVTGANKGLGREIARRLSLEGLVVYLGARDAERGRAAAEVLSSAGGDVRFLQLDVTDEGQIQAAVARLEQESNRLDVLVNNAGVLLELDTPVRDAGADDVRATYAVNVFGVIAITQCTSPPAAAVGARAHRQHEHPVGVALAPS